MTSIYLTFQGSRQIKIFVFAVFLAAVFMLGPTSTLANHPVLVEGNCLFAPFGHAPSPVPAGTCGDYDGDGRIGINEDNDGDRVFGTLTAALGSLGTNQNGMVTIVASGTFNESIVISGNITLQAANGVEASIDAVLQGDTAGANDVRQGIGNGTGAGLRSDFPGQFGIIVSAANSRRVVIRNITIRNWGAGGIHIGGDSHVTIDNCRFEHNINYGIDAHDNARVTVTNSLVQSTGFRVNPTTGDFPNNHIGNPGHGISFRNTSSGIVSFTVITGNFAAGLINSGTGTLVAIPNTNTIFDNGIN